MAKIRKERELIYMLDILSGEVSETILELLKEVATRRQLLAFQKKHQSWIRQRGITGFGLARKTVIGVKQKQIAIKAYVKKKRPINRCKKPIPEKIDLPGLGTYPTDIEEMDTLAAQVFYGQYRPIRPGASISHEDFKPGTIGCIVKSTRSKDSNLNLLLSCEHVLYNGIRPMSSHVIYQPARKDTTDPNIDYRIGHIHRRARIRFRKYVNDVDAAVAKIRKSVNSDNKVLGNNFKITKISGTIREGDSVYKVGRTTETQFGNVEDPNFKGKMRYEPRMPGGKYRFAKFRRLIKCNYENDGGDSGGPVFRSSDNALVGIHLGGNGNYGVFCRISTIFDRLDIKLPHG